MIGLDKDCLTTQRRAVRTIVSLAAVATGLVAIPGRAASQAVAGGHSTTREECVTSLVALERQIDSLPAVMGGSDPAGRDSASAAAIRATLSRHRATLEAALSACDQQARTVHTRERELQWVAAAQALRRDADRLERLSAADVTRFLAAHRKRVDRFIAIHRAVVGETR